MIDVHGYAALNAQSSLTPFRFSRREVGRQDVLIKEPILWDLPFGCAPGAG